MTPIFEIFKKADKVHIDEINKDICKILSCEIQLDDMSWVKCHNWQEKMVSDIVNNCIYKQVETYNVFQTNQYHHGFSYNILYACGDVYIINMTTHKIRKIRYDTTVPKKIEN